MKRCEGRTFRYINWKIGKTVENIFIRANKFNCCDFFGENTILETPKQHNQTR
jgi:hypothetical protein